MKLQIRGCRNISVQSLDIHCLTAWEKLTVTQTQSSILESTSMPSFPLAHHSAVYTPSSSPSGISRRWKWRRSSLCYLSFHASTAFLLLLLLSHVFILLFGFWHSLKKLIKNAKELIRLDFASLLPKVFHCFSKLEEKKKGEGGSFKKVSVPEELCDQTEISLEAVTFRKIQT